MQATINKIVRDFQDTEQGRIAMSHFVDMTQHPGWKIYQAFLMHMGNSISNEVISRPFQGKKPEEKLVTLEAYSKLSEVIHFLVNPVVTFRKVAGITEHNIKQKGATKRKRPSGGKDGRRSSSKGSGVPPGGGTAA